jgi:hypothetical protein
MKKLLFVTGAVLLLSGCGRVVLPHKTLSYKEACPGFDRVRCHPDDDPRALIFNLTPPVLEIIEKKPAYNRFLGRAYRQPYQRGDLGRYCNDAVVPLFLEDVHFDTNSAAGTFVYSYKLKSTLDAGADADLVKAATAAGLPPAATEKIKAAAKVAYNRAKEREVSTTGRMRIVRLSTDTVEELRRGSGATLAPCRQFLIANPNYSLVKAMTVFHIENSSSDTQIASEIAASVKGSVAGVDDSTLANVNAAIDRSVEENIQTALSDRYLIWAVSWLRPEDT